MSAPGATAPLRRGGGRPAGSLRTLLLLAAAGLALYLPGLDGRPYGDDFAYVFEPEPTHPLEYFARPNPYLSFYRPIDATVHAAAQRRLGPSKLPVHLVTLAAHVLLCWLVVRAGRSLGWRPLEAALAGALMLASQANAMAVAGVDGLSQVGSTLFLYLGLWWLYRAVRPETPKGPVGRVAWAGSVLAFGVALLFKEAGAGFLPGAILVVWLAGETTGPFRGRLVRGAGLLAPHAALFAAYLGVRAAVLADKAPVESGRYALGLGWNVVRNLAELGVATISPVSSVSVVTGFLRGNALATALHAAAMLAVVGAVAWGVVRSRARGTVAALLGIAGIALAPVLPLGRVSELYAYAAMPAVALAAGLGLGSLLRLPRRAAGRSAVAALLVLLLAAHVAALRSKIRLMVANGERAATLVASIVARVDEVPRGGALQLCNPPREDPEYSVFVLHGFNVLRHGLYRIYDLSGRRDFGVFLLEAGERDAPPPNAAGAVRLTLDDLERSG